MRFDIVTLFPEFFRAYENLGVTGRAVGRQVELHTWNPRDFSDDKHQRVDDRPYGGGPGMVMLVAPLVRTVEAVKAADRRPAAVSMLSPQGRRLDQGAVETLAGRDRLVLVCGRYEGIDERFVDGWVDEEWSIGDFVLSGGELAAAALIDAVSRLLPGVLGDADSAREDSFVEGLLDCPHYSRPEQFAGVDVPQVLLSGNHGEIARWRRQQALVRTWERRPGLLLGQTLSEEDKALLRAHSGQSDE